MLTAGILALAMAACAEDRVPAAHLDERGGAAAEERAFEETAPASSGASRGPVAPDTAAAVRYAISQVRAGLAHSAESRAAEAAAAYGRAADRLPEFASWAHLLAAAAYAKGGDTAEVRRRHARADTTLVREWGWRAAVDAAAAAGDSTAAARRAEQAAGRIQDAGRRADAWTRAGVLHAAARRNGEARAALRNAIDASAGAASAVDAARTLAGLGATGPQDHLRIGRVYLRHGNLVRAGESLDAYFASGNVAPAERARLQLDLGRAQFNARNYAAAERRLRSASTTGAPREVASEAMFLLGRSQYRRGESESARSTLQWVTREYANTTAAARAHFVMADIDHDAGRLQSARTHYQAVVDANGPDAGVSAVRIAAMALMDARERDAARTLAQAYRSLEARSAKQTAGYWYARALERAGERDSAQLVLAEVRRIDPFSYYGLRAGELLGSTVLEFGGSAPASAPAPVRAAIASGVDVIEVLRGASLDEAATLAATLLQQRYGETEGALYALGAAYHARERPGEGIRIGRELLRREGSWNRQLLELVYPFPYRDAIVRNARANGLDPFLVAGLIRQESWFNPRARSGAGAIGLMQVMPATGTRVARALGLTSFRTTQLTDPAVNLRLGTRYLADQIRGHGGRMVDAIAAYNAGPHRVERWRTFPEYRDPELFTERIPYEETREYVKIVQQNARIYRALYGP